MIPEINGTKQLIDGQFTLSSPVLCAGEEELFSVLEERLKQAGICHEVEFVSFDTAERNNTCSSIRLIHSEETLGEEAYRMEISPTKATVFSSSESGFIWGLTTLYQLLIEGKGTCPCQVICDAPIYGYRGFHLDCSRHFFSADTVRLMIELASRVKINRMHWHISDDQGYRLESKCFPKLNTVGSWRKEEDESVYGGYYTMEEVKDIVSFAKIRGVEIIPEIDLPGHVSAIIAAYPNLSCSAEPLDVPFMPGIHRRILCGGDEEVLEFVFRLLDEVAPLFPFPYFHIGGDEAPKDEWQKCPKCQAKMRELGLHSEEELQTHFSSVIADHLKALGKTAICWNEALKSSQLPENICVQYWDDEGEIPNYCEQDLLHCGRDWIYSFTPAFYFDFIPALAPLRKVYHFTPVTRSGCVIPRERLFGIECALWSEQFSTQQELLNMAFPRMYAIGERGWCAPGDYEDFKKRCEREIASLFAEGISIPSVHDADPYGERQKQLVLEKWRPVIAHAKAIGMENMGSLICRLVHSKLNDQFSSQELDALLKQLQEES